MRFMQGRYGMDQFGRFIAAAALFCALLSMFLRHNLFYWIALALIAYSYFRMFSRNISKRYAENVAFQKQWNKFNGEIQQTEKSLVAAQVLPYLHLPQVPAEDPDPQRKGEDQGQMPEMRRDLHPEVIGRGWPVRSM